MKKILKTNFQKLNSKLTCTKNNKTKSTDNLRMLSTKDQIYSKNY